MTVSGDKRTAHVLGVKPAEASALVDRLARLLPAHAEAILKRYEISWRKPDGLANVRVPVDADIVRRALG